MLLTIDVGNTQTHIGLFRGDQFVTDWRMATVRNATGDELATQFAGLLELSGLRLDDVRAAIVSTVVPQLQQEYEDVSRRYLRGGLKVVGPGMRSGMPIRIENPHELGPDRLMNALAAYHRYRTACVVVDFGTALNYDVVSATGEYLGGIISPGIVISVEALFDRAARLPRPRIEAPRSVVGRTTQAALQSGVVYGFAGQVDGIVARLRDELGEETRTIATGGLAAAIVPFCEQIDDVDNLLTLTGLRLMWERNR